MFCFVTSDVFPRYGGLAHACGADARQWLRLSRRGTFAAPPLRCGNRPDGDDGSPQTNSFRVTQGEGKPKVTRCWNRYTSVRFTGRCNCLPNPSRLLIKGSLIGNLMLIENLSNHLLYCTETPCLIQRRFFSSEIRTETLRNWMYPL